jgi:hypothetical protein
MKAEKSDLVDLAPTTSAGQGTSADPNPNPPYGDKSSYRKITVTLPQASYQKLIQESARRKIAGEPKQLLSALLREAVDEYLSRLGR